MTKRRPKDSFQRLYSIAEAQHGFFTTKQAVSAGFDERHHNYHVQRGNWIREHRGIYRLANFPQPERPDLVLWALWSRNRQEKAQGVYSHQTALSLYELSDLMPAKLHITVPPSFRRNSAIPKILILHKGVLAEDEIKAVQGVRVTSPLRTIADLAAEESVSKDILRQALREALSRGLITQSQAKKHPGLKGLRAR